MEGANTLKAIKLFHVPFEKSTSYKDEALKVRALTTIIH